MDFDGRKGFLRLALEHDVPIVPVVSVGGQETALFLTRGEGLARLLRLDRMFRLKVLPISLALPWVLNVGDMLGHVPLPAKITIDVLEPIDLREEFGEEPDLDEVYARGDRAHAGSPHGAPVGAPAAGARLMRVERSRTIDAPREEIWERVRDPPQVHRTSSTGITRCEPQGRADPVDGEGTAQRIASRASARASRCA